MPITPCAILCIDCPEWDDELGLCSSTETDYEHCINANEFQGV